MAKLTKKASHIVDVLEQPRYEEIVPSRSSVRSFEPEPQLVRQGTNWQATALVCVSILLVTAIAVAFYAFHRVGELNEELSLTMGRMEEKLQSLDAGISFDSKRQQLLLGIRDEIMRANARVSLNEAYQYAQLILRASEKYPSVDPLMFLAIGTVESGYNPVATSRANAKGLYQIWPSTGRLLARALDWEYSEEMLYDPEKNTEMAALYLDILYSAYNDHKMVLAEYNGGPLNAGYLRAGSAAAAAETRDYVSKVQDVYETLKRKFERGIDVQLEPMHKDGSRDGKLLGVDRPSRRAPDVADATAGLEAQ